MEKENNMTKEELELKLQKEEQFLQELKKDGGAKGYGLTPILYAETKKKISELKKKLK